MVEGHAIYWSKGSEKKVRLTPLELVGIIVHRHGWDEVDAEPTGNGDLWKVTAKGPGRSVSATGTLSDACRKLIERMDE